MANNSLVPSPLQKIVAELGKTTPLDRATVRKWMQTDDIEAAGALMDLLGDPKENNRIDPPLMPEDYYPFVRDYYMRSMLENPDGEWADSTTLAGFDFARWFNRLWSDLSIPRSRISELKESLKGTYIAATPQVRSNIINSALEGMFRNPQILEYFSDWGDDPLVSEAYRQANESADAAQSIRERAK
jgi:hypothetical protein